MMDMKGGENANLRIRNVRGHVKYDLKAKPVSIERHGWVLANDATE